MCDHFMRLTCFLLFAPLVCPIISILHVLHQIVFYVYSFMIVSLFTEFT